ncbi:transcription factor HES-3 [Marmota marmota marmota]|uniref:transcription factor HES-3 n=1 Tax=Marmota marmota marmota TaxID=9994 RepID=UPI0020931CFB|nr:transcription factor HES-3 [Marmota marmota marmota]
MEKKRRARINVSLEQLKSLLEKHYSHQVRLGEEAEKGRPPFPAWLRALPTDLQIRKRKLEKADILELSVKYMKSLQNSLQGLWSVGSGAEYPTSFRGCLPGVSQLLRRGEEGGGGLRCPLVRDLAGSSTMDSASTGPEAPALGHPSGPGVWGPAPTAGGSRSPPPRLLFPGGLPGSSTSVPEPPPASCRRAESPGPGMRVWRPW